MPKNNISKNKMLIFSFVFVIFGLFFFAGSAAAQTTPPPAPTSPLGDLDWSSLNKLGGLRGASGVQTLIGRVIKIVMGVVGSIALIMFVAGGLMWMTAAGNAERTGKALRIITWSSLGIVVIFSAYILTQFVFSAF